MTSAPSLKFHHRISFKILLGITLLILAVEAVLFAFSVSSRRQEQMYREDTYQTLPRHSERPVGRDDKDWKFEDPAG